MTLTHEERERLRAEVSWARRTGAAHAARLSPRAPAVEEVDPLEELRPELWKRVSPRLIRFIAELEGSPLDSNPSRQ